MWMIKSLGALGKVASCALRAVGPSSRNAGKCTQGTHSSFSHVETLCHALDFALPIGTPVLSARDGVVVDVVHCFKGGGAKEKYKQKANFIVIRHEDGTYGRYYHLAFMSAVVSRGDVVKRGQLIAKSGSTGFSLGPHLHFDIVDCHSTETSTLELVENGNIVALVDSCFATFSFQLSPDQFVQRELVLADPIHVPSGGLKNANQCMGRIVLCKRGGESTFLEKALEAQRVGAKGLIIMNSDASLKQVLPLIGGKTKDITMEIEIPVVAVTYMGGVRLMNSLKSSKTAHQEARIGISPYLRLKMSNAKDGSPFCKPYSQPFIMEMGL